MPAITMSQKCQGPRAWPAPATQDLQGSLLPCAEPAVSRNPVLMLQKVFLLTLLLLTMAQTAHAYWLESKPEPFSLREREHAPPSEEKMFFTIQDNFELFTDKIAPGPLLLPHSDYFVPADIIDINLPLFGIFSHPSKTAEDPIANLLYANLKIKKLLEEYNDIQERAQRLLQDESGNLPIGKMQVNANESADNRNPDEPEEISIYKELHQKLTSLSTANLNETHTADTTADNDADSQPPQARVSTLSFLHLQKKTESPLQTTKLNRYNSPESGKIATAGNPAQSPSKYSQQQAQVVSKPEQSNQYSGETTLPWLLELPFKIFNYLLSHKIQALFIGLFGLITINVIFGSRH